MDSRDPNDDALVQKLFDLNRKLTQITSNKNDTAALLYTETQDVDNDTTEYNNHDHDQYKRTPMAQSKRNYIDGSTDTSLHHRIHSLEGYLQKMRTQFKHEQHEKNHLPNTVAPDTFTMTNAKHVHMDNENSSRAQSAATRQQFVQQNTERPRVANRKETQNEMQTNVHVTNKMNALENENAALKAEVESLRAKVKDCNGIIASNEDFNKNLMQNLKNEKSNLIHIINENETKVTNLNIEIQRLRQENKKLELQLKDRDDVHSKLLKNKQQYQNALAELLTTKQEANELEKTLKEKMYSQHRLDHQIRSLNQEKSELQQKLNSLKLRYQTEITEVRRTNEEEIQKLRKALQDRERRYHDIKNKHETLKLALSSKAVKYQELRDRINDEKETFEQSLNELVAKHAKKLQSISKDTEGAKEILAIMQEFNQESNGPDFDGVDSQSRNAKEEKRENELNLNKEDLVALGIWEPDQNSLQRE